MQEKRKMLCKPKANLDAEAQPQQSRFATLLKSHQRTDLTQKICSISAEHPPPTERIWGTAFACQKNFKTLEL